MKPSIEIYRLGRISYNKALALQQALFDKLKFDTTQNHDQKGLARKNSLLLLEHQPVYTVGIRSQQYNHDYVLKLKDKLAQNKQEAEFVQTNRGGLITYHGPGQLVAYPIIYLGDFNRSIPNKSVKAYVKKLEYTIIDTLARIGIQDAQTVHEYPGVWLGGGDRKIAFVGITCKRYVTMHGISINCDCDLTWFENIVSCGIEGKAITSVHRELQIKPVMDTMITSDSHTDRRFDSLPKATSSANSSPVGLDVSSQDHLSDSKSLEYDVKHVADAFCLSFSQQFECEIHEAVPRKSQHLLDLVHN